MSIGYVLGRKPAGFREGVHFESNNYQFIKRFCAKGGKRFYSKFSPGTEFGMHVTLAMRGKKLRCLPEVL